MEKPRAQRGFLLKKGSDCVLLLLIRSWSWVLVHMHFGPASISSFSEKQLGQNYKIAIRISATSSLFSCSSWRAYVRAYDFVMSDW
jgi:hypothetical protein